MDGNAYQESRTGRMKPPKRDEGKKSQDILKGPIDKNRNRMEDILSHEEGRDESAFYAKRGIIIAFL